MSTYVSTVRNVNEALENLRDIYDQTNLWRVISPRGMETKEFKGMFVTEYTSPCERVLFNDARDCNPFFHFFEALWILDGRDDVEFLAQFNSNMVGYSDDGITFHAAYGKRMRSVSSSIDTSFLSATEQHLTTFKGCDQLHGVIELLKTDPDTRRAVICLWSPELDLGNSWSPKFEFTESKDIPCNDLLMFKLREGVLDLTVSCRSNDAIWGAYGANAVQFSTLLEFVALAVNAQTGCYRQVSDSFHIYTTNEAWVRIRASAADQDPYLSKQVEPFPIMQGTTWKDWLAQNNLFLAGKLFDTKMTAIDPYFSQVADPMLRAHKMWKTGYFKKGEPPLQKHSRLPTALAILKDCVATDWRLACEQWIIRRAMA